MKCLYLILTALFLFCLAPMPYGHLQLVRFVAMVVFGVLVAICLIVLFIVKKNVYDSHIFDLRSHDSWDAINEYKACF